MALRDVSAPSIGALVHIKAIVTRVSDVKPLVTVITYTCDDCGMEVYQTVRNAGCATCQGASAGSTDHAPCGASRVRSVGVAADQRSRVYAAS